MKKLPRCTTYKEVMVYYQGIFNRHAPKAESILKTDCFNEIGKYPVVYRSEDVRKTYLLEYSQEHIDMALKKNPKLKIVHGDIREKSHKYTDIIGTDYKVVNSISFYNYFDFIFDVSTLDHIPQEDVPKALDNYETMLRDGGTFALVTWFNENGYQATHDKWSSTDQYCFDFDFIKSEIEKRFKITYQELVLKEPAVPGSYLYLFEARGK